MQPYTLLGIKMRYASDRQEREMFSPRYITSLERWPTIAKYLMID